MDRESSPDYENMPYFLSEFGEDHPLAPVWKTMKFHQKYLESFESVHTYLLHGEGPLNITDRHFIAMTASARHSCLPLMSHHAEELRSSLPPSPSPDIQAWIDSGLDINQAPTKLKRLIKVNKILAHRPWMIKKQDIEELTRGEGRDKWLLSELVQAIILMCHFHAFSSFTLGCGLMEHKLEEASKPEEPEEVEEDPVPIILKKMESLSAKKEDLEIAELTRRFEKIETQETLQIEAPRSRSRTTSPVDAEVPVESAHVDVIVPSKYSTDMDFQYVDFVKRSDPAKYPTFRTQEFSWDDHGFTTVNRFYCEDVGHMLDQKFSIITNLTYRTIGSFESVDTSLFRQAIQHYIQCLYGIRHDDYDYGNINELLPRTLKKYIKTVSCYPEYCTRDDYNNIMTDFKASEKVHVCILVCEAKFQSELIYALKAVADYYT